MSITALRQRLALARQLPPPERRRELRETPGISLRAVVDAVGVSASAVAFWERGERTPTGKHLAKYIEVLALLEEAEP